MAEIKVQRKSGVPWWLLLLLVVLLFGLIWWFVARAGGEDDDTILASDAPAAAGATAVADGERGGGEAVTGTPTATGAPAAGEPVTDMNTILTAGDARSLVGRDVRLEDVPVQQMVGDAAFWIGATAGQRVLVILNEQIPSPPPSVEGRVNVNAGQTVDIRGRMRAADDLPGSAGLEQRERDAARGQQVYVWAESAEVVSPASAAPAGPPGRR